MKSIILIASVLFLSGCGAINRMVASTLGVARECVNGVSYLQFPSGAALEVDINGKPVCCK